MIRSTTKEGKVRITTRTPTTPPQGTTLTNTKTVVTNTKTVPAKISTKDHLKSPN